MRNFANLCVCVYGGRVVKGVINALSDPFLFINNMFCIDTGIIFIDHVYTYI